MYCLYTSVHVAMIWCTYVCIHVWMMLNVGVDEWMGHCIVVICVCVCVCVYVFLYAVYLSVS